MIIDTCDFNKKYIQKIIEENFEKLAPTYYRLLSEWMNSSYEIFNDIDKYRIILYLINKDFDHYIQIKKIESYDNFFMFDKSLELDRINIIEISKNLNIPKESARRKILDLEKLGVLQKIGKKIYIDRSAYKLVRPRNTLKNLSILLSNISEVFKKVEFANKSLNVDEVSKHLKNNFTYCWYYFYIFIFTLTSRWKRQLGDLEIYAVGMVITCHSIVNKSYEGVGLNFSEWKKDISNINESGVNTMSISEITHIPRPTVVRKLNYLLKNKYISVNKKKQFTINMKDQALVDTIKIQEQNISSLSDLVFKIFQKIKN
jgi:DNA-binding Lrp family transcriptional regulator